MPCTIDRSRPSAQAAAMRRIVGFLCAASLFCPQWAAAQLQPHRAEYALRLGPAINAPRIGTATQDLTLDCAGWHLKRHITTEIAITAAWKMSVASTLEGEEPRN